MKCRASSIAAIVCAVCLPAAFHSGAARASGDIQHNPFARPPAEKLNATTADRTDRSNDVWRPQLRAVLVAGSKSVADLGGVILSIGQSINGYRLVSVREETATFTKNGEPVVLSLYESEFGEQQ